MLLLLQFWITFFFFKNEPKSTFSKKTSYFGTLALSSLFHLLKLAQACTSSKKFYACLLMHVRVPIAPGSKSKLSLAKSESMDCAFSSLRA
jgi:hypothetical protein